MAQRVKTRKSSPVLPERIRSWLGRTGLRLSGVVLLVLFTGLSLALISFNRLDPAFNTGSAYLPENWLGYPGAFAADLLLQTLGLASAALVLPLLGWAWRVGSLKGLENFWLRLGALPLSIALMAAALSALPKGEAWPFETGYGGLLGQEINAFTAPAFALVPEAIIAPFLLKFVAWAALGAIPFFYSLGLTGGEWAALARGFVKGIMAALRAVARAFALVVGALFSRERGILVRKRGRRARREPVMGVAAGAPRHAVDRDIHTPAKPRFGERRIRERQQAMDFGDPSKFKLPTLDLLTEPPPENAREKFDKSGLEQNARLLESVLEDFGIEGEVVKVWPGPVVTLYELEPAPGTKAARIISLADDIARSMSAVSARVATVPGRNVIGIELPNSSRRTVFLREILASENFEKSRAPLPLALGKDISGNPVIADLGAMPHLLVAGTTGSGKSVGLNAMILSLLYRMSPHECRFVMVDPKMLELSVYDGIPHLLTPVVTEPKKAIVALKWAVREMEDRYRAMSKLGVRSLNAYNKRVAEAIKQDRRLKKRVQTGFDKESGEPVYETVEFDLQPYPQIVVVIDEMADLMLVAGKDVEASVQRLSQMARAAGIHLIMATQRPSVDVITGTIKANFPTRIAFQVTSKIDSRTILGEQGAEQLLGAGDMLFMTGSGRITRIHGPFVSDQEVERVVAELKRQGEPDYLYDVTEEPEDGQFSPYLPGGDDDGDDIYAKAIEIVRRDRKASTSYLQRRLQIGYNRAANLIEQMEEQGIVSEPNSKGQREVLLPDD